MKSREEVNFTLKRYKPEMAVLFIYMSALAAIMIFHEPWFDEAQAWLIARDAPIRDIMFLLPHYEGHPPIWHLILMPFARSGVPYELSLRIISFTFCSISIALLLFKAPFERKIKLIMPFNYFLFYQYGVICRPYSMMMLGFILAAVFYKNKDIHPIPFILSLAIVCSSSAYGIILSAGICIVWVIKILKENKSWKKVKKLFFTKRCLGLSTLLLYNLFLINLIIPAKDAYAAANDYYRIKYLSKFIYAFFVMPGDASYTNVYNYIIPEFYIDEAAGILGIICSSIVIIVLLCYVRKKNNLLLLLIPYALFASFTALVYFSPHHIGIVTMFFIFVLWCCHYNKGDKDLVCLNRFVKKQSDIRIIKTMPGFIIIIVLIISSFYSITASVNEIKLPHDNGKEVADFIKNNHMENYKIFAKWPKRTSRITGKTTIQTHMIENLAVLPYFNRNIFYNYNCNNNYITYLTHKIGNENKDIEKVNELGVPDIIIGYCDIDEIFHEKISCKEDYIKVYKFETYTIWKTQTEDFPYYIYVRKDLMKDFPKIKELEEKKQ